MPIYNKLVRDKIPDIIQQSGKTYQIKTLDEADYKKELIAKLTEEIAEYIGAPADKEALEELADILEVVKALSVVHGASLEEIETIRQEKAEKRGGFEERIYLLEVED